jgi:methionyl aminopeptidase
VSVVLKSPRELEIMVDGGRILAETLQQVAGMVAAGVTTGELDRLAEERLRERGAVPASKGYKGFPATLCTSVNEEVIHGIPGKRKLREGDVLKIDCGAVFKGYYLDHAITVVLGETTAEVRRLLEVTRESLDLAIAECLPGARVGDISAAVQSHVEGHGFGVVREFVGHGVGSRYHEDLQIPNYGPAGRGPVLRAGMTLAIEPMTTLRQTSCEVQEDGWTAVAVDGSIAAHFEHTVAVTEDGPLVLTLAGSEARRSLRVREA